jgi:hypothetical protein
MPPCERLRSKPMWALTYPKNRPCGYAVDMLRTTSQSRFVARRVSYGVCELQHTTVPRIDLQCGGVIFPKLKPVANGGFFLSAPYAPGLARVIGTTSRPPCRPRSHTQSRVRLAG